MSATLEEENAARLRADVASIKRIDVVPTILEVVCRTTGMGFAAVARVTQDHWVACDVRDQIAFGLKSGGELKLETTICNEIRVSHKPVVIDHVAQNEVFSQHPTPLIYGFQSYISMPIFRRGGDFFGTLCAIDPRPARLDTPETRGMFKLFADLIGFHLDTQDRLETSEAALLDARQSAELREQFIAVLGHDLRNPLSSISAGASFLRRAPMDPRAPAMLTLVEKSVRRMAGLIDNVLDFARGRLGGGLALERNADRPLQPELEQVTAELRAAWPTRTIEAEFALNGPIYCDQARIGQLLSNLLANALAHGKPGTPICVAASLRENVFEVSVVNQGEPIPASTVERLFQPFFRAAAQPAQEGLGLGLYIVA
ncbi:MAG: GAF domain-containing sensor histidine kinase, partial [Janthinobacterium lividum]